MIALIGTEEHLLKERVGDDLLQSRKYLDQ